MKANSSQVGGKAKRAGSRAQARYGNIEDMRKLRKITADADASIKQAELVKRLNSVLTKGQGTDGKQSTAPGQAYLDCLNRRAALTGEGPQGYSLTLPGLCLSAAYSPSEVLYEVSLSLFVSHELITECVLARLPAWEAVEFAELVCISNGMHGQSKLAENEQGEWTGGLPCGSFAMDVLTNDLLLHFCSVLYHHAELLGERLVPKLPFDCEAVRLARALAIAEQVLAAAGDKAVNPGTVANPSRLLQRALEVHAAALLRSGEGMRIDRRFGANQVTPYVDDRIGGKEAA